MNNGILNDTHYRELNKALGHISSVMDELERAKRAGLEVDEIIATMQAQKAIIEGIKREYFPQKP